MIHELVYEDMTPFEAELMEIGLGAEGTWAMAVDARIRSQSDPIGTGPVIYKGKLTKDASYAVNGAFLFWLPDRVSISFLWTVSSQTTDLADTIAAYAETHGASLSAMLTHTPEVI